MMIGSFKDGQDGELARFYLNGKRSAGIPVMIEKPLRRKLSLIEAASSEKTLFAPPSNNYERLRGNLEGWSSIRVSLQWRLIFRWRDGHAYEIYLDPHKYRYGGDMDTTVAEPTTVGEMLSEEFLKPLNITQAELALVMGVPRKVIGQIVNNSRRLSVAEASQLAVLFQTDEDFWINLQASHDRWESRNIIATHHFKPIQALLGAAG